MWKLKPKEQHEQLLANADKAMIVEHLSNGQNQEITKIAVALARECNLFVHFQRLWNLRVFDLDEKLRSERYVENIYVNRRTLYKELNKTTSSESPESSEQ